MSACRLANKGLTSWWDCVCRCEHEFTHLTVITCQLLRRRYIKTSLLNRVGESVIGYVTDEVIDSPGDYYWWQKAKQENEGKS